MDVSYRRRIALCITTLALLFTFLLGIPPHTAHAASSSISEPATGITITVDTGGAYTISTLNPAWTFAGNVNHTLSNVTINSGTDSIGAYKEITFTYLGAVARKDGLRTYDSRPVVLFSTTYLAATNNSEAFPTLTTYPQLPYHQSHSGTFGIAHFDLSGADSPWLFFDAQAHSFMLSPAANFMVANTVENTDSSISSGINSGIATLPQNFTHKTMLVIGNGINSVYTTWGQAMTDLQGKVRAANDADVTLNKLGYWTDNGAAYYYNYDSSKGYTGTLQAVKQEFTQLGIPLGYMQLDSWWYPKGSSNTWQGNGTLRGGEYTYTAAPALFPNGLATFQQQLGLPLITHARWIDSSSPYRAQYAISNNVSTDPRFWSNIMGYIKTGGVMTYEQDWLSNPATANNNLSDPQAFMNNMAAAAQTNGLTLQYCMPQPRHYLQGTEYSNLTTMRVSDDRFEQSKWNNFLYDSRLGSALGIWPWTDVFMSSETDNLLLSTLSGGMVGVGDQLGTENKTNLLQSVRPDAVIVKPDASIVPTDETYIAEAQGSKPAMVAYTYTDHTNLRDAYVFAYNRSSNTTQTATFTPNELGVNGQAYVYNYFNGTGSLVNAGQGFSDTVGSGSYYLVAPVGQSGMAFLGDAGKFVSTGHKRISHLADNGTVQADVAFAPGEGAVIMHGYSPTLPTVSASNGSVSAIAYNSNTHLFSFSVSAGTGSSASIVIKPGSTPPPPVTISNLKVSDTANAAAWSLQSGLQASNQIYGDRTYTVASLPATLAGDAWIRTADSSKLALNNPLVTFTINQQAHVYVGVDTRLGRPSWIDTSWSDTGQQLLENESSGQRSFEVYQKTYAAGQVALGPNGGVSMSDMYTIAVL